MFRPSTKIVRSQTSNYKLLTRDSISIFEYIAQCNCINGRRFANTTTGDSEKPNCWMKFHCCRYIPRTTTPSHQFVVVRNDFPGNNHHSLAASISLNTLLRCAPLAKCWSSGPLEKDNSQHCILTADPSPQQWVQFISIQSTSHSFVHSISSQPTFAMAAPSVVMECSLINCSGGRNEEER